MVSGGDEFWNGVAAWNEWAVAGAAVVPAVVLFAPEAVAIGGITEGTIFLTGSGEYVTVSASVIAHALNHAVSHLVGVAYFSEHAVAS